MDNMIDPMTGLPMASGPNTSRPMHSATTGDTSRFTIPEGVAQSGIPGLNPAVPADQLKDLDNPYSQTT